MKLYMAISADKYELPCFVSDDPEEVAHVYHMNKSMLMSSISRGSVNRKYRVKFIRIEVDNEV